ncbi:AGE family epimerase/isomerase [Xanthobacter wiegelii]|uniref:AGE family epimerase/isomerase n=1 Tax=Xanthobacter wiegelii TaxID=3119913 RepID=UPI00372863F5
MALLEAEARWAREWLFDAALPLWWRVGSDPEGGFHEKIALSGEAVPAPRRLRVQARQVYVYVEAGRLGWPGPWREAAAHGLDFLLTCYRRPDGLFRMLVAADGTPLDDRADLYDQAFALFALAQAHRAGLGGGDLVGAAHALMDRLMSDLRHPLAGFEEALPRTLPLRSNPHMHMLEANFAWIAAGIADPFADVAREIVDLAANRLIDPATGAIGEYFDGDWRFSADTEGGVREPGHQFEWAYLLDLAGPLLGADHRQESQRLYAFGTRHGIDPARGAAVFALDAAGRVIDPRARLWAQTERLRTALVFARAAGDDSAGVDAAGIEAARAPFAAAREAFAVTRRYLDTDVAGLWRDQLLPDGSFVEEAAPASSFYHIVSAFAVLLRVATPD